MCRNSSHHIAPCSSSLRYKTDVEPYARGLDIVGSRQPIRFLWKESGAAGVGFAAEDAHEVEPLLTFSNARGEIEGVRYDQLSAVFVNAFREQQGQIQDLESRLAVERDTVTALQSELASLKPLICAAVANAPACPR